MKSFDFETNYYVNFKSNGDLLVNFIGNSTISQGSNKDSDPIYHVANKAVSQSDGLYFAIALINNFFVARLYNLMVRAGFHYSLW